MTTVTAEADMCLAATRSFRVLVVEDDLTSREYLRAMLRKGGWQVSAAEGVCEAQGILSGQGFEAFDCVVTDYRMPGGSGLDLLAWLQSEHSSLATIILTAEGEKGLVADSLRGGAVDFLEKPVGMDRLNAAIIKASEQTRRRRHLSSMESAARSVGRTQLGMLSAARKGERVHVDLCFHPKQEAGGDFFTQFCPSPGVTCCLLTDVSGHDLEAAYVSAYFQGVVRGMLRRSAPLSEIFGYFNELLLEEWNRVGAPMAAGSTSGTSVAVCSVLVDWGQGRAGILNCGAPAPVYVTPEGRAAHVGVHGGAPLGWFAGHDWQVLSQPVAPGGLMLMWTDGLEDLAERNGVSPLSLGLALQRSTLAGERLPHLAEAGDDILFARVCLGGPGEAVSGFQPVLLEDYRGGQLDEIDEFESAWGRSLRLAIPDLPGETEYDLLLASREAVLNALCHGCDGDPERSATIQIGYDAGNGRIRVVVEDPGPGHQFDVLAHATSAEAPLMPGHRGLLLMRGLATELRLERRGATAVMDFCVPRCGGSGNGSGLGIREARLTHADGVPIEILR